ncbi:hypothetical protein JVT61DRAFT_6196 [Boletus reticuloceps]|uniref:C2H2-type domain-containing protein n=1 Tax=Boletus reticuloceps TaxID=495285 RepID=A0A8I3A6J1_9AGAM|nr:hypothetical protein JVT61DRAFT_6196 [Boletus reticuloceps]
MPQAKTTRRQLKTISCPHCGRKFRTEMNVLQHMNQPAGLCNGSAPLFDNSHDDPIHGVNVDLVASPSHATVQLQQEGFKLGLSEGPNVSHKDKDIDMNDIASDSPNDPPVPSRPGVEQLRPGRFLETFKGCGETFSGGKRFMDDFWADHSFSDQLQIKSASLSFHSAKVLRARAEVLPSGPKWICETLQPEYPVKQPLHLFYRNPIECLQALLSHPLFALIFHSFPGRFGPALQGSVKSTMSG